MNERFDEILLDMSERGVVKNFVLGETPDLDMIEIDWERLMLEFPEWYETFWQAHMETVRDGLAQMVEDGYLESHLDMNPDSETYGEVVYRVTELGALLAEEGFDGGNYSG